MCVCINLSKVVLEEEVTLEEEVASLHTQLVSAKVTVLVQQHYKYLELTT